MVSGKFPFFPNLNSEEENDRELVRQIINNDPPKIENCRSDIENLIFSMLQKDPNKRPSIEEIIT